MPISHPLRMLTGGYGPPEPSGTGATPILPAALDVFASFSVPYQPEGWMLDPTFNWVKAVAESPDVPDSVAGGEYFARSMKACMVWMAIGVSSSGSDVFGSSSRPPFSSSRSKYSGAETMVGP